MKEEPEITITPTSADAPLWNAQYVKAMWSNFLLYFAFYLLTPLLPIYLDTQFGADKDTIGIVLSGYVVAALLVRPLSGFLVDTLDRKRVLVACYFFFFILFAGYVGAASLLMFAIVRTIHGFPFGSLTVANQTVAIDVLHPSRRNEGIGFYGLSNNLAMAFAPSAGIWIYNATGDFSVLFWISLLLALVGLLMASGIRTRKREAVEGKPHFSLDHFFLTRGWLLAVNICFFGACWGIMSNYVAIYGRDVLSITDGTGLFFMLLSAGLMISRFIGVRTLRRGLITRNAAIGVCLSLVGYSLFALMETSWSYYASAMLIGLGNGQMYPAFLNMFVKVARHDQRGTASSSILTAWDLGMGLGILAGGILVEYCGYFPAFAGAALLQLAGAILYLSATRKFFDRRRLE